VFGTRAERGGIGVTYRQEHDYDEYDIGDELVLDNTGSREWTLKSENQKVLLDWESATW